MGSYCSFESSALDSGLQRNTDLPWIRRRSFTDSENVQVNIATIGDRVLLDNGMTGHVECIEQGLGMLIKNIKYSIILDKKLNPNTNEENYERIYVDSSQIKASRRV